MPFGEGVDFAMGRKPQGAVGATRGKQIQMKLNQ